MNITFHMQRNVPAKERAAHHLLSGLVLGAILLPTMLYGAVAWQDRIAVLKQAEQNAQDTTRVFNENASNVFQFHRLVASVVNEHIRGMSWQQIADFRAVHDYLADLIRNQPRIQSLWLIDSAGMVRNSSAVFPVPQVSVADRDYFIALRERDTGTFIGQVVHGRVLVEDIFNVAQRRVNNSGTFDGVVDVSALPSYFTNFWNTVAHELGSAILIRRDGAILARLPAINGNTPPLGANNALMQAIERSDSGSYRGISTVDGRERLYAYQMVSGFPVYVGYGINLSSALRAWHAHLLGYGGFFVIGTLALLALALAATHRLQKWRETVQALRSEMDHRERIEAQLRQAQKMEALGQIAGQVSHDFGNILNVISGSLEMLESHPDDATLLTLAKSATDRATRAIKSLLSFARREPISSEIFDFNAALRSMDALLRQAMGTRIKLEIALTAAPCWTVADRNQAELAILNVAINARDATPDGGTLTVTTRAVHLTGEPDGLTGDFIAIALKDIGTGMPPEVQAKVFEPFFTTKGPGQGTGLGLSMVYGFTKQSHGTVTIDSAAGEGTTVILYLPFSAPIAGNQVIAQTESAA